MMKTMHAGRGHNRPPPKRSHELALESAPVQLMMAEMAMLRSSAIRECNDHIFQYVKSAPWEFFPSRLRKSPTKRAVLIRIFHATWKPAIQTRLGQIRYINRKLARCCANWRLRSDTELVEPPLYDGYDIGVYDSARFQWRTGR